MATRSRSGPVRDADRLRPVGSNAALSCPSSSFERLQRLVAWVAPVLYLLACWALLLAPGLGQWILPQPRLADTLPWTEGRINETLARHLPTAAHAAWQLGYWAAQGSSTGTADHLEEAAHMLHLPAGFPLTHQRLLQVGAFLQQQQRQAASRAATFGAATFANLLWIVAIIGLLHFLAPAFRILCLPLLRDVLAVAWRVCQQLTSWLVWLLLVLLPLYAWAGFYVSLLVVGASPRYPPAAQAWLVLLGQGSALFTLGYCWRLEGVQDKLFRGQRCPWAWSIFDTKRSALAAGMYTSACMVPLAVLLQSTLLGFMAIGAAWGVLFCQVASSDKGYLSQQAHCAALLSAYLVAKAVGVPPSCCTPFSLGVSVYGSISWYCISWSAASHYVGPWAATRRRLVAAEFDTQLVAAYALGAKIAFGWHVLLLVAGLAVGHLATCPGLANTATMFGCFFLFQQVSRITDWEAYRIVLRLLGCGMLLRASVFFAAQPEWLASMLSL